MIALRSARARATVAGAVFLLALAAVVVVALWRTQDMSERHHSLAARTDIVVALDNARADILAGSTVITAAAFVDDPRPLLDSWRQSSAAGNENLRRAEEAFIAIGDTAQAAALGQFARLEPETQRQLESVVALAPSADVETRMALARQYFPQLWPRTEEVMAYLGQLAGEQQARQAAEAAAADEAGHVNPALLFAVGGGGVR